MTKEVVSRFAELLLDARRRHIKLTALPPPLADLNMQQAVQIQDEVARRLGFKIGGWKVGIPPGGEIYSAPVFDALLSDSPAEIVAAHHPTFKVEGEIAFRMGRDLPYRATPYTRSEVIDSIESACVAIEILCWRLPGDNESPFVQKVADNLGNGALICGRPNPDARLFDRDAFSARLTIGGKRIAEGEFKKPSANQPMTLLTWLANHLAQTGGLTKGQVVTTGTWVGTHPAAAGDVATVEFDELGSAEVRLV
jgi:2-keto-4-pentenoate hydratase